MRTCLEDAMSVSLLTFCGFLIVLWGRSMQVCEYMNRLENGTITAIGSNNGTLYAVQLRNFRPFAPIGDRGWTYNSAKVYDHGDYDWQWDNHKKKLKVPYRLLVPLLATLAVVPWMSRQRNDRCGQLLVLARIAGIVALSH